MTTNIRLPRLLNASLQEVTRLNPSRLQVTQHLTPLSSAVMELPEGETIASVGQYAEIFGAFGSMGIFRVTETEHRRGADAGQILYLTHGLTTLSDDVLPGYTELGGGEMTTSHVLERLLACQSDRRWILGDCDYAEQFAYSWENENLLTAVLSVAQVLPDNPVWDFDQSQTPWRLHLRRASQEVCECRMGRGLQSISVTENREDLCTRLYPLGYGEGADQLNIAGVNGGVTYLQADTAEKYGVISCVWTDTSITEPATLLAAGKQVLEKNCRPAVTAEIEGIELAASTGETLDRLQVGRLCRIPLPKEGVTVLQRIISARYTDVLNAPEQVTLTLSAYAADASSAIASLQRKSTVGETYSQGAASEYSIHFGDNCDEEHPAVLRFFLDQDAIHVNSVKVRFSREAFRAYEKATASGGQVAASDDVLAIGSAYMNSSKRIPVSDGYVTLTASAIDHSHHGALKLAAHTHRMVYGIYEGDKCESVTVTVDGNSVPAESTSSGSFDVASYLSKDATGRIRRGAWHEVVFTPSGLGRIEADMHVRTFIRSLTGAGL